MARIEGSVEIAAPRQAVWDLLADPSRHTEFGIVVAEVRLVTEGEVREGTVYRERSGPAFMKSWSEWTVTRFDPPRELVHASKEKSMTAVGTWTLTEVGSGSTRVTQVLDSQLMPRFPTLGRLLDAVFAQTARRETDRMLRNIKRIAEGGPSGSSMS